MTDLAEWPGRPRLLAEAGHTSVNALLPFLLAESDMGIISTARWDTAALLPLALLPLIDGDPLTGPKAPLYAEPHQVLDVERKFPAKAPDDRPVVVRLHKWSFEGDLPGGRMLGAPLRPVRRPPTRRSPACLGADRWAACGRCPRLLPLLSAGTCRGRGADPDCQG